VTQLEQVLASIDAGHNTAERIVADTELNKTIVYAVLYRAYKRKLISRVKLRFTTHRLPCYVYKRAEDGILRQR